MSTEYLLWQIISDIVVLPQLRFKMYPCSSWNKQGSRIRFSCLNHMCTILKFWKYVLGVTYIFFKRPIWETCIWRKWLGVLYYLISKGNLYRSRRREFVWAIFLCINDNTEAFYKGTHSIELFYISFSGELYWWL